MKWILPVLFLGLSPAPAAGETRVVTSSAEFRDAASAAMPGDTLVLEGDGFSGLHAAGLRGEPGRPITIRGGSAGAPARLGGGNVALHLSGCHYVTLRFLEVAGCRTNGINIDDGGGDARGPSRGIIIEDCAIAATGGRGNQDALKMSGVDAFVVRRCRFAGWGGSGIDIVGCHDGVVADCQFEGKAGFAQANGVQMKGGSARIVVRGNFFRDAGQRVLNIGGSTGLAYFRPEVGDFEAEDIEVVGNRMVGGMAAVAWINSRDGHVHHNTIYLPEKWVGRILQENVDPRFQPSQSGVFANNLVVFDRRVRSFINVGTGTAPETFVFRENAWFESGGSRRPDLPVAETAGVHGVDPELTDPGGPAMAASADDASLAGRGAHAAPPEP